MKKIEISSLPTSIDFWQILTLGCGVIYVTISIVFVLYGQLNADEGWYLYSSKLVYEGQLPYKDFAFTQTPLLPFVYGFFQKLGSSALYIGRITSVLLSTGAFYLSIRSAIKVSGKLAGFLTALFWATFTYGIYFQSITKTYSLLILLFSATFYVLLFDKNKERGLILASLFVLLAILTRLSALFFALPILGYAFYTGTRKTKLTIFVLCVSLCLLFSLLFLPNWSATTWNLLLHHTNQWGDLSRTEKISAILRVRLPLLFLAYPTYSALMLVLVGINFRTVYPVFKKNKIVMLIFISSLLFAIPHLISGGYHAEYFVTMLFMMFSVLSILSIETFRKQKMVSRIFVQTLILSTFLLGFARGGWMYIDLSGGSLPIEEVQNLAALVDRNSNENDSIFALEGLSISLESNRETLPGMTMAQFSYYEGDKVEATKYNLINDEMIADSIRNKTPSLIILTSLDWELMKNSAKLEEIERLIFENYSLLIFQDNFGQHQDLVEIYSRNED